MRGRTQSSQPTTISHSPIQEVHVQTMMRWHRYSDGKLHIQIFPAVWASRYTRYTASAPSSSKPIKRALHHFQKTLEPHLYFSFPSHSISRSSVMKGTFCRNTDAETRQDQKPKIQAFRLRQCRVTDVLRTFCLARSWQPVKL